VRGEAIAKELNLRHRGVTYSVLFYAAWCPFSSKFRPIFEALSTMFPQIYHFTVEESSAMPSLFSRYGVRGFPAILLVNETTMVRYWGPKDLSSLVDFYKETTGTSIALLFLHTRIVTTFKYIKPRNENIAFGCYLVWKLYSSLAGN
jgi:thiol-disulfide isomerase/thioredoxin